jgi:hypothetical protein
MLPNGPAIKLENVAEPKALTDPRERQCDHLPAGRQEGRQAISWFVTPYADETRAER